MFNNSKVKALELIKTNFINQEQYNILFKEELQNINLDSKDYAQKFSEQLKTNLTEYQKKILFDLNISYFNLAKALIYYGRFTNYRVSYLMNILPKIFFDKKNKHRLENILTGNEQLFIKNKKTENIKPHFSKFEKTEFSYKDIKNIKNHSIFENHEQMTYLIRETKQQGIEIPKILVNFDSHSDIYVNIPSQNCLGDWINTVIVENNLTDIYWICPSRGFYMEEIINHFLGFNQDIYDKNFHGIYNKDIIYKDINKPLTQRFIINKKNKILISESVNYSDEEFNSYLKKDDYQQINIHICTKENMPKLEDNFILSIDADYFNCSGFDSNSILEQIPFNINYIFNEFLETYKNKLNKSTILGLCISPEYIGLESIEITKQFFNYLTFCINS